MRLELYLKYAGMVNGHNLVDYAFSLLNITDLVDWFCLSLSEASLEFDRLREFVTFVFYSWEKGPLFFIFKIL